MGFFNTRKTPEELLKVFQSANPHDRIIALDHDDVTMEIVTAAADDPDLRVRELAARIHLTTPEVFAKYLKGFIDKELEQRDPIFQLQARVILKRLMEQ
jgi:hypothetical protein